MASQTSRPANPIVLPGARGRVVVGDTETTGFYANGLDDGGKPTEDPFGPDRVIEVALMELVDLKPTGQRLHLYFNPRRPVPLSAFKVHGLGDEFLRAFPEFREQARQIREFVGSDIFVAHNASFDARFFEAEFARAGVQQLRPEQICDTLKYARSRWPMAKNSLDALCDRFKIDRGARQLHGAMLDTQLLAEVLLHLHGGRQMDLLSSGPRIDPRYMVPLNPRPAKPCPQRLAARENFQTPSP